MTYQQVIVEKKGRVGVVQLNRPERMNALGEPMRSEMNDAIRTFNEDPTVGAIVLTGVGKAFCAGADMGGWQRGIEARESGEGERPARRATPQDNWVTFVQRSKPIVCAINGAAVGAGLTITLPCDVRIASDQARLSMRFVRAGVVPELASSRLLTFIVGFGQAMELMLTGRIIDAQEAGRIGLVNRVVPQEQLLDVAVETAAEIAFNPDESVRVIKEMAWAHLAEADITAVMRREGRELDAAMQRPSFKEAVGAFLEKRQPDFHGAPVAQ